MVALLLGAVPPVSAQTKEYQVKAAFLYNFAQFVTWPTGAFSGGVQGAFVIGVIGDDPFGSYLDDLVRNQRAGSHPISVQRFRQASEASNCQILYIAGSEAGRYDSIVSALRGRNILTVSDINGFAEHGGMIAFVTENNRVRFKINVATAKAAGLTISSKVLRVAEVVN
jgi:hypothetical protein